ncbi:MAG: hypothetical protein KF745_08295 [Phycisphaeraceae bacterium]|nr:hypothetical protein [Phycisphaeraceae bacterium]
MWTDTTTNSESYAINIFKGSDPDRLPPDTDPLTFAHITSSPFTIPAEHALPPGTYTWELVGCLVSLGFYSSGDRQFVVHSPGDWDMDGAVTPADIAAFSLEWNASLLRGDLNVDVNADGVTDPTDFAAFIAIWIASATV